MLEFIVDFVLDILFDGAAYIFETKKIIPTPIRIIAGIIVAFLYAGFGGLCIFASVLAWMDKETIPAILFFGLGMFVLIGGFIQIRKGIKKRKE